MASDSPYPGVISPGTPCSMAMLVTWFGAVPESARTGDRGRSACDVKNACCGPQREERPRPSQRVPDSARQKTVTHTGLMRHGRGADRRPRTKLPLTRAISAISRNPAHARRRGEAATAATAATAAEGLTRVDADTDGGVDATDALASSAAADHGVAEAGGDKAQANAVRRSAGRRPAG